MTLYSRMSEKLDALPLVVNASSADADARKQDKDAIQIEKKDPATEPVWRSETHRFDELQVSYEKERAILWCRMNPKDRPSVTPGLARESRTLQNLLRSQYARDSEHDLPPVRYMVWGSNLSGIFNLGGDLQLFSELIRAQDRPALMDYATTCIDVVYNNAVNLDLPMITISHVEGDALGGGFEAAVSSNVVIAERRAKFGLPEVLFNLFPGMGAYSLLSRKIGAAQAERMIFSGRVYTAEELHEMGLIDILADDGSGREAIYNFVKQNDGGHAARCAVYKARNRCQPLTYQELYDITESWVDTALSLTESDLKRMGRIAAAQDRRRKAQRNRAA